MHQSLKDIKAIKIHKRMESEIEKYIHNGNLHKTILPIPAMKICCTRKFAGNNEKDCCFFSESIFFVFFRIFLCTFLPFSFGVLQLNFKNILP